MSKSIHIRARVLILSLFLLSCLTMSAWGGPREYAVRGNVVLYHSTVVRGAHISSFRELGYGYARDRYHVYYRGDVLPYVSPDGFRVGEQWGPRYDYSERDPYQRHDRYDDYPANDAYYKDSFNVYFDGKKLPNASPSSFQVLNFGYAKDAFRVYFMGREISNASSTSFRTIGDGYAVDAFNAYYLGRKLPDASGSSSFRNKGNGYAGDHFNTYLWGRKLN